MNGRIEEFKAIATGSAGDTNVILDKAAEVLDILRTDMLEPVHYEKLYNQAVSFIST